MKNILLVALMMLFITNCFSQIEFEREIFYKIIKENTTNAVFYIGCEKLKTSFDSVHFNEKTGLEVPLNVLEELVVSSNKSRGGNWDSEFPIKLGLMRGLLNSEHCQTKKDIEVIFEKTKKRQSVFLLSEPIFDESFEHCIISFSCIRFKGSTYGNSYFLKKVYGSWTIIAVFDSWIS